MAKEKRVKRVKGTSITDRWEMESEEEVEVIEREEWDKMSKEEREYK